MIDKLPQEPTLLFRPDTFFLKPWHGWGVVRDWRGLSVDRYRCHGQGRTGSRAATTAMTYEFDSGVKQTIEWDILSDDDGHYFARDPKSGMEGRGRAIGNDFRWVFTTPAPGALGKMLTGRATATYTLMTPETGMGVTEIKAFGITVRSLVTFFQHS